MDIALVSYIYFELGNMIILAYELVACVLGILFHLHVTQKIWNWMWRGKQQNNSNSMDLFVIKTPTMEQVTKTSKKY